MRTLQLNKALRESILQEMESDDRVFVFGEDVALHGGLGEVTKGLLDRFGPDRVHDAPIAESAIAGLAVGAALMGMRPIVEMQFTGLITVALDQIANSAAKTRYVYNGAMNAPLVIRTVSYNSGNAYMGQALEAWVAHVPGLKIATPSTPYDAKGLLTTAIRDPDPVVFVEHVEMYQNVGPVPRGNYVVPFGQASVPRVGSDVTIVAWMNMVPMALEAANKLENEDVSVEVVDLRTLVPLDKETVIQSVIKTGRLVIAHEAVRRGGFGAEIAAIVSNSKAFRHLKAPITRVANIGAPIPHSKHLQRMVLPNECDIIEEVRRVIAYK